MHTHLTLPVLLTCGAALLGQSGSRLDEGFGRLDRNQDGFLSPEEIDRFPRMAARLDGADADGDGRVSAEEFQTHFTGSRAPHARPHDASATTPRTLNVDGHERRYLLYLPRGYDATQPTPLVLAFHGGGGSPHSMIRLSGLNEKADEAGFIVVYPYGSGRDGSLTFNGGDCCGYAQRNGIDDIAFVRTILDDVPRVANVDARRVYATGISNGAIMTYLVASELSDRIAAIAPVAGPMATDTCAPTHPVAVMHFHGTDDAFAPFNGGVGKEAAAARNRPVFRSVEHAVTAWIAANGCRQEPRRTALPDVADDGMHVMTLTWPDGRGGSEVILVEGPSRSTSGGWPGHVWPPPWIST
ncbi:MAG: PHB depolymerase family esterase, partial [Planctomycetota bacterium]